MISRRVYFVVAELSVGHPSILKLYGFVIPDRSCRPSWLVFNNHKPMEKLALHAWLDTVIHRTIRVL